MNRRVRSLALLGAPLLLAGCMVGPKYVVPNVAIAPAFKETGPVPQETAQRHRMADRQTCRRDSSRRLVDHLQ